MVDARKPFAFMLEEERTEAGEIAQVATIFLTNRECPWRCLMCDLWKNTLTETVPIGAIPAQIDYALGQLCGRAGESAAEFPIADRQSLATGISRKLTSRPTAVRQVKLYNSGSFFDPRAIPVEDYPAIARRVRPFDRIIVECHPALVGQRCLEFRDWLLAGGDKTDTPGRKLEVAMGLETAQPDILAKLNKRMTLDDFERAAGFLRAHGLALRVFILVKPPFQDEAAALEWAAKSAHYAFACGATAVSLIPTRPGNGALERLIETGEFRPPRLATLERAMERVLSLHRGRVFADIWDLDRFSSCSACIEARRQRLQAINLSQQIQPSVECPVCRG
jgi:radical SAM enzyme (TIGR01210 family)